MTETLTATKNYDAISIGPLPELLQYDYNGLPGKCFVGNLAGITSAEISINRQPAGVSIPFIHKHYQNEEIYIITGGSGVFWIDGESIPVREGSVVRVSPEAERTWKASALEDLYYICVQAPSGGLRQATLDDGEICETPLPW